MSKESLVVAFGGTNEKDRPMLNEIHDVNCSITFDLIDQTPKVYINGADNKDVSEYTESEWKISEYPFKKENQFFGMTREGAYKRARFCADVIYSKHLHQKENSADTICFYAHSRGCGIALETAHLINSTFKRNVINKIILLDPVSKNQGSAAVHRQAYASIARSLAKNGVEIYVFVASILKGRDNIFQSYCNLITSATSGDNYQFAKKVPEIDNNIFVCVANSGHSGMFSDTKGAINDAGLKKILDGEELEPLTIGSTITTDDVNKIVEQEKKALELYVAGKTNADCVTGKLKGGFLKKLWGKDRLDLTAGASIKNLTAAKERNHSIMQKMAFILEDINNGNE